MQGYGDLVVGICDDEYYVHSIIMETLNANAQNMGLRFSFLHFYSAYGLLSAEETMDCLLLDIDMSVTDGIEAARQLNRRGMLYKIIIITSKTERFKEGFEIGAFRFVTKPISDRELCKAIEDVHKCRIGVDKIQVYRDGISYNIMQKDILFIMANNSSTIVYADNNEFRSGLSLIKWEALLDARLFYKCHKSYLLNLGAISDIKNKYAILKSGDKVEISRRKMKEIFVKYMEYDTKYR